MIADRLRTIIVVGFFTSLALMVIGMLMRASTTPMVFAIVCFAVGWLAIMLIGGRVARLLAVATIAAGSFALITIIIPTGIIITLVIIAALAAVGLYVYTSVPLSKLKRFKNRGAGIGLVIALLCVLGGVVAIATNDNPAAAPRSAETITLDHPEKGPIQAVVLAKQDGGAKPTTECGSSYPRYDAYAAPKGSNNFGPDQNFKTDKEVFDRLSDKLGCDVLFAAGTYEFWRAGSNFDPQRAETAGLAAQADPAKHRRTVDDIGGNIQSMQRLDLGNVPYFTVGMIPDPSGDRGKQPHFTQWDVQPAMGKALLVVFKKRPGDQDVRGVLLREACDLQFSAPMPFSNIPQAPTQPSKPVQGIGGGDTSTPSGTTTIVSSTPVTSSTTTPATTTPGTTTPGTSTKTTTSNTTTSSTTTPVTTTQTTTTTTPPQTTTSTANPKGSNWTTVTSAPMATETGTAAPPVVPSQPAGTTTTGAPAPGATAPGATATQVPNLPTGNANPSQTAAPGGIPIDPDGGSGQSPAAAAMTSTATPAPAAPAQAVLPPARVQEPAEPAAPPVTAPIHSEPAPQPQAAVPAPAQRQQSAAPAAPATQAPAAPVPPPAPRVVEPVVPQAPKPVAPASPARQAPVVPAPQAPAVVPRPQAVVPAPGSGTGAGSVPGLNLGNLPKAPTATAVKPVAHDMPVLTAGDIVMFVGVPAALLMAVVVSIAYCIAGRRRNKAK